MVVGEGGAKKRFTEGIGIVDIVTVIIETVMDGGMIQGRVAGKAAVAVGVGAVPTIGTMDTPCKGIEVKG